MKFKDIFKIAIKNIRGNKKRFLLTTIIFSILFFTMFTVLIFEESYKKSSENFLLGSYLSRSYVVNAVYEDIDTNELKADLEKIGGIKKVIYSSEVQTSAMEFDDSEIGKGYIVLLGSDNEVLPKIIQGNNFTEENQIICPTKLLFNGNSSLLSTGYIDTESLFNQEIDLIMNEYDFFSSTQKIIATHTYKVKIVGTFDSRLVGANDGQCLASFSLIKKINEKSIYNQTYLNIIIDDNKNLDRIKKEVYALAENKNTKLDLNPMLYQDDENFDSMNAIVMLIVFTSLMISILCEILFVSKNLQKRTEEIGIYKSLGYSKKDVRAIILLENSVLILISFISSVLLLSILIGVIIILANTTYFTLLLFSISIPSLKIVIIFTGMLIMTFMTSFINFNHFYKKTSKELME